MEGRRKAGNCEETEGIVREVQVRVTTCINRLLKQFNSRHQNSYRMEVC